MFIRHIFQYCCYIVRSSFHFETLFSAQPINLVVEEITRNKSVVQTPITYFINRKGKRVYRHNSILTLDEIRGTIFPHWYNVHDLSWCKLFFSSFSQDLLWETCCKKRDYKKKAKNMNYCPSDIICNSFTLKYQCLKHT